MLGLMILLAFAVLMSPWPFLGLCIFFGVLIMVVRLTSVFIRGNA